MEALETILSRRSIRKYIDKQVGDEAIVIMLKAAMSAPSANNHQPWEFVVITDRKQIDALAKAHPYAKMLFEAPLAILVCGDVSKVDHLGYLPLDCSAATQNLLLAAHALGLGAVWLGVYPREERISALRTICSLPDNIEPIALISIGYPGETKAPSQRFDKAKVRLNSW